MNYLLMLLSALVVYQANNYSVRVDKADWAAYKLKHEKKYESPRVDSLRQAIYSHNKQRVDQFHEAQPERDSFQLELNHLADLNELEMVQVNGFRAQKRPLESANGDTNRNSESEQKFLDDILSAPGEVPDALDWRSVPGRVSQVKNQGMCGSCWAFSAVGALEGQEKVRSVQLGRRPARYFSNSASELIELSEQNLVDCVKDDAGCNGGQMSDAFRYVNTEGGIDDERSYPYEGRTRKCRFQKSKVAFSDTGAAVLPLGDEQKLKEVVAKFGPVAVAIDASSFWFQLYRKGVYVNKHCHSKEDQLDHGVLVVGYGTDPKKGDYWIVKNSWGAKWGEHGYIRMARNRNNMCGIATAATIPTF